MNEKLKQSWDKIEPNAETSERMLQNIRTRTEKNTPRRVPYKWAAAIVLLCIMFSSGVYAFNTLSRIDTGGTSELVMVDPADPDFLAQWEGGWKSRALYVSHSPAMPLDQRYRPMPLSVEQLYAALEMLEGKVFTSEGEPFEFIVITYDYQPRFKGMHHLELQGDALYTYDGKEIGIIWYDTEMDDEPKRVRIITIAELNERFSTLEEALAVVGDFRLPTVFLEKFHPPTFSIFDWEGIPPIVFVNFHCLLQPNSPEGIYISIENIRAEGTEPRNQRLIPGGEATTLTIADITVYKITAPSRGETYTWAFNGHVYELIPPWDFTAEQTMALIVSMVE